MSEKLTRKEMRAPDAFQRASANYWNKLLKHKKVVFVLLGALLAVVIAVGIVDMVRSRAEKSAGAALAEALDVSRRGVEGSYDPAADPDLPKFANLTDKRNELASKLEAVTTEFAGTPAATTATLNLAGVKLQLGDLAAAQAGYQRFLDLADRTSPLRFLAYEGLGYVFEARKEWDKALDAFASIATENPSDSGQALSTYHRARILEQTGQKMEAAVEFQKVKESPAKGAVVRLAEDRLNALVAQGFAPPKAEKPTEKPEDQKPAEKP